VPSKNFLYPKRFIAIPRSVGLIDFSFVSLSSLGQDSSETQLWYQKERILKSVKLEIIGRVKKSRVISKKALLKYAELKNVPATGRRKDEIIQGLVDAVGDAFFEDFERILAYVDNISVQVVIDLCGIPRN